MGDHSKIYQDYNGRAMFITVVGMLGLLPFVLLNVAMCDVCRTHTYVLIL